MFDGYWGVCRCGGWGSDCCVVGVERGFLGMREGCGGFRSGMGLGLDFVGLGKMLEIGLGDGVGRVVRIGGGVVVVVGIGNRVE